MPMSTKVTVGLVATGAPTGVVMRGAEAAAPCTQSGHWNPTEALIMQSVQIGRPHRVHVM
jgi:hypothetical protein